MSFKFGQVFVLFISCTLLTEGLPFSGLTGSHRIVSTHVANGKIRRSEAIVNGDEHATVETDHEGNHKLVQVSKSSLGTDNLDDWQVQNIVNEDGVDCVVYSMDLHKQASGTLSHPLIALGHMPESVSHIECDNKPVSTAFAHSEYPDVDFGVFNYEVVEPFEIPSGSSALEEARAIHAARVAESLEKKTQLLRERQLYEKEWGPVRYQYPESCSESIKSSDKACLTIKGNLLKDSSIYSLNGTLLFGEGNIIMHSYMDSSKSSSFLNFTAQGSGCGVVYQKRVLITDFSVSFCANGTSGFGDQTTNNGYISGQLELTFGPLKASLLGKLTATANGNEFTGFGGELELDAGTPRKVIDADLVLSTKSYPLTARSWTDIGDFNVQLRFFFLHYSKNLALWGPSTLKF